MKPIVVLASFLVGLCVNTQALADHRICGRTPEFDARSETSERTKSEITARAQALAKMFGSADLIGKIETERRALYRTSERSEAARQDAYMAFVFCVALMDDQLLDTASKLRAIQEFRRPIR